MRTKILTAVVSMICLTFIIFPIKAQSQTMITKITVYELKSIISECGYSLIEVRDVGGDQLITADFTNLHVIFLLDDSGGDIAIHSGFDSSNTEFHNLRFANNWNAEFRYARVYVEADNGLVLQSDLNLEDGITKASIKSFIMRYSRLLTLFTIGISARG